MAALRCSSSATTVRFLSGTLAERHETRGDVALLLGLRKLYHVCAGVLRLLEDGQEEAGSQGYSEPSRFHASRPVGSIVRNPSEHVVLWTGGGGLDEMRWVRLGKTKEYTL